MLNVFKVDNKDGKINVVCLRMYDLLEDTRRKKINAVSKALRVTRWLALS